MFTLLNRVPYGKFNRVNNKMGLGFSKVYMSEFLVATGNMTNIATLTAPQLGWIVFTAILLFGYVSTWYAGLKLIPASRAACVLLLGSAITTLLSFIYAGSVTITGLAGVSLILSGVIIIIGYSYIISKIKYLLPSKTSQEN